MANFSSPLLLAAVSTSLKTTGQLWVSAATPRRLQLYEVEIGQAGLPSNTDAQCQWDLSRTAVTATLAGTAVTPQVFDEGDGVAVCLFTNNASAETTYTSAGAGLNLKQWGINQRGSYRWRALDDGDQIMIAATALKGIGIRVLSPGGGFSSTALGTIAYVER